MLRKLLYTSLLMGSLSAEAYVEARGPVTEIRTASYWNEICFKVGSKWFYLDGTQEKFDFNKSMLLTSYASGKTVYMGSGASEGSAHTKCDSLQAYPYSVMLLQ